MGTLTEPMRAYGIPGVMRLGVAWVLAPIAVISAFRPDQASATMIIAFTVMIGLAVAAARWKAPEAGARPTRTMTWAPLIVAAPAILGYIAATLLSVPALTLAGAIITTVLALVFTYMCLGRGTPKTQ